MLTNSGAKFTLTNAKTVSCVMSQIKQCFVSMTEPRPGVFRVIGSSSGVVSTDFFYSPLLVTPARIIHGHGGTFRLSSCPPKALVQFTLSDKRHYSVFASAQGSASIIIPMPKKGKFGVLTTVAGVALVPDHTVNVV